MDLAVAVIVGGAFGKIVSSLVADVVMPPIGLLLGNVNFSELAITLGGATGEAAAVTMNYGKFIQTVVDFLIIAFVVLLAIKGIKSLKRKEEVVPADPPKPSKEEMLLTEIRDLLKQGPLGTA